MPLAQLRANDPALTSLSFVRLNIGNAGAAALAQTLKQNSALSSLELGDNSQIGEMGFVWLAEALRQNRGLAEFAFHGSTIGAAHKATIEAAIGCNRKDGVPAARAACKEDALKLMRVKQEL